MINILVIRKQESLNYKRSVPGPDLWHTNDNNNCLDSWIVQNDSIELFRCKCQTISNMEGLDPDVRFYDTISPGNFFIKAFRYKQYYTSHYGRIHGIVGAITLHGDFINDDSVTKTNKTPWMVHDWQRLKPIAPGTDTRVAWSAGCIVLTDAGLVKTGDIFDANGIKPGDKVPCKLIMEAV